MLAETVTGYVGQILDEGEFDEHTHKFLQKLYNIALKEMEEEITFLKEQNENLEKFLQSIDQAKAL